MPTGSNIPIIQLCAPLPHHLSCSSTLPLTTIQLQLHANRSPVLQRRKGGTPNWMDWNSVHQAGNESIMLRNSFWGTERSHWVRGVFCLQRVCILRRVNQESQHSVLPSWHLLLWCSPRSTSQNIPLVSSLKCDRLAWMIFHSLHICILIFV